MYLECINVVMTQTKAKATHLQIRIREDIKEDLRITSELKGLSVSGLVHSLIVKAVREEKEKEPQAFQNIKPVEPIGNALNFNGTKKKKVDQAKEDALNRDMDDAERKQGGK